MGERWVWVRKGEVGERVELCTGGERKGVGEGRNGRK